VFGLQWLDRIEGLVFAEGMSMGWRDMACSTSSGTGDGPGDCRKRRPGMRTLWGMGRAPVQAG